MILRKLSFSGFQGGYGFYISFVVFFALSFVSQYAMAGEGKAVFAFAMKDAMGTWNSGSGKLGGAVDNLSDVGSVKAGPVNLYSVDKSWDWKNVSGTWVLDVHADGGLKLVCSDLGMKIESVELCTHNYNTKNAVECDYGNVDYSNSKYILWTAPTGGSSEVTLSWIKGTGSTDAAYIVGMRVTYSYADRDIRRVVLNKDNMEVVNANSADQSTFSSWPTSATYISRARGEGFIISGESASGGNYLRVLSSGSLRFQNSASGFKLSCEDPLRKILNVNWSNATNTVADNTLFSNPDSGYFFNQDIVAPNFMEWSGDPMSGAEALNFMPGSASFDAVALEIVYFDAEPVPEVSLPPVIADNCLFDDDDGKRIFTDKARVNMTASDGALIFYRLDGVDPIVTMSGKSPVAAEGVLIYSTPIVLSESGSVRTIAVEQGKTPSAVAMKEYRRLESSSPPKITGDRMFSSQGRVIITSDDPSAAIFYTLGGADPEVTLRSDFSAVASTGTFSYSSEGIEVAESGTIKAIAVSRGQAPSPVSEMEVRKLPESGSVEISGDRVFTGETVVSLSGSAQGDIYYTLSGTDPSFIQNSDFSFSPVTGTMMYSEPLSITETTTIRAVLLERGKMPGGVTEATFTSAERSGTPLISGSSYFMGSTVITLSGEGQIFYTLDGSDPELSGDNPSTFSYDKPFEITATTTVTACAVADGLTPSKLSRSTFTRLEKSGTPEITGQRKFVDPIDVALSGDGQIFYTADGSEPIVDISEGIAKAGGTTLIYSSPLRISDNTTIKAVLVSEGKGPGDVAEAVFTKMARTKSPQISGDSPFADATEVSLIAEPDAIIVYTTDGTTPQITINEASIEPAGSTQLYSEPIILKETTTIKAAAWLADRELSEVVTKQFSRMEVSAKPEFRAPAIFDTEARIEIVMSGGKTGRIFFTTDGSTPEVSVDNAGDISINGTTQGYTEPFIVTNTTTIRAVAIEEGKRVSQEATHTSTLRKQTEAPVISGDRRFVGVGKVTISIPLNTRVYFTTDGTDPELEIDASGNPSVASGNSATRYTEPFIVDKMTRVKAVAHRVNERVSPVAEATFSPADMSDTPLIAGDSPFAESAMVTISAENGAKIYYTLDGSDPDVTINATIVEPIGSTSQYSSPFKLSEACVVKAIALEEGKNPSAVVEKKFAQFSIAAAPEISGDTPFDGIAKVIIKASAGQTAYYTLDGSDPIVALSNDGTIAFEAPTLQYTAPITISATTEVRAIAASSTSRPSAVTSKTFEKLEPLAKPQIIAETPFGDETEVIISAESGTEIFFTLDGRDPKPAVSPIYANPFILSEPCTIKAVAAIGGKRLSEPAVLELEQVGISGNVVITGDTPFLSTTTVAMTASQDAAIYYTLDGTDPKVKVKGTSTLEVSENALLYTEPLQLSQTATIKALAVEKGLRAGNLTVKEFNRADMAASPAISAESPFAQRSVVRISSPDAASIFYTLDGTVPQVEYDLQSAAAKEGTLTYTGTFTLTETAVVVAVAFEPGKQLSTPSKLEIKQMDASGAPTISGVSPFTGSTRVEISAANAQAAIFYTLDGTDPRVNIDNAGNCAPSAGTSLYISPIVLEATAEVRALAVEPGRRESAIASRMFTRMSQLAAPEINVASPFGDKATVTIVAAGGASIRFTLDGSNPESFAGGNGTDYTSPFTISSPCTIKAIAFDAGSAPSEISIYKAIQMESSTVPQISVSSPFISEATVSMNSSSQGTIYYTLDGTDPKVEIHDASTLIVGENTLIYSVPITITERTVVKAILLEPGKRAGAVTAKVAEPLAKSKTPTISGTLHFHRNGTVEMSAADGATLYYTLDGSDPSVAYDTHGQHYPTGTTKLFTTPISLSENTEVRAMAVEPNSAPSEVAAMKFFAHELSPTPSITGITPFITTTDVSITGEGQIYYTLDGSLPEFNIDNDFNITLKPESTAKLYEAPLRFDSTSTVTAVALASGSFPSEAVVKTFEKQTGSIFSIKGAENGRIEVVGRSIHAPEGSLIYDLEGRIVSRKTLEPGIYIVITEGVPTKVIIR